MDRNEILLTVFDACRCGYLEFVTNVFDEYPSDINITNSLGQTCLMLCCEFNSIDILKYLISKKDIHYLSSDFHENWNCLHYALRYSNFRIAQLLLNKSSSSIPFPKYCLDSNGYSPFDLLPPNIYKKQLYDCKAYTEKRIRREIYASSFAHILSNGHCLRMYDTDDEDHPLVSNLSVQGVLYAWGSNKHNQLGLDNNQNHRSTPKMIKHLRNISIIDIACSGYHSIAVSDAGGVYVWGNNSDGRCGVGHINKEYKPFIIKPMMLCDLNTPIIGCTATLDHSTLISNGGDVYVFGCDRNSKLIKYSKKQMKLVWNNKLSPFCVTSKCKYGMHCVSSTFERSVMIGNDHKLYFIGKALCGNKKLTYPTTMNTSCGEIKKIGVVTACIGDNWLVVLLLNGHLLSMNRPKQHNETSDYMEFTRIRLNKEFRFKHHHNQREEVKIRCITCYAEDGYNRCIAVGCNDDIYEWKPPSTDAVYIGHMDGISSISCAHKCVIMCNDMGECYAFGDQQILGLSSKDKKLLNINLKTKTKTNNKHNIVRIVTLTQIGKVFATKDSVFVIQSFLWPNRNMLNANHYHEKNNKLRKQQMEETFWNEIKTKKYNNDDDLYNCYNLFECVSLDIDDDDHERRASRRKKKKHNKKAVKKVHKKEKNTLRSLDDDAISKVPSLVSFCEDILIHQIDIQTVISLYKQSHCMGFHRISVFLSFVIIENIQHLLYFLLRDCSENQVLFVEQLFKTKYYRDNNIDYVSYYGGDAQYLSEKKRIIEEYRILPRNYPNYKHKLSNISTRLNKIKNIEEKVEKWVLKEEGKHDYDGDKDAEIIYFDSDHTEGEEEEEDDDTLKRALQRLNPKERTLYECKLQILSERNDVLFCISNPASFPSLQMMDKWKRRQKKRVNYNSYRDKHHKIKDDKRFIAMGIAESYDADKYLKHVYLKQSHSQKEQENEIETGFSFYFDYDLYNKPKHKQHSKAVIYRVFDVKDAMDKDAKKARKMHKKQEKEKRKQKEKSGGKAKKRRNRKKQSSNTAAVSPTIKAQNAKKKKQKQNAKQHTPRISNKSNVSLSPIDVVRRNREKKLLEQQVSGLTNDVWDLAIKDEANDASVSGQCGDGSLSDILSSQKNQYEQEKRKRRHEKCVQYQETQNAWSWSTPTPTPNPNPHGNTSIRPNNNKSIRPNPNTHGNKDNEIETKKQRSVIEIAQTEEIQLRWMAQHEHGWMMNTPQGIGNKTGDDYDLFIRQQQLLLQTYQQNKAPHNGNGNQQSVDDNNERQTRRSYGNRGSRGRGGHGDGYNEYYGDGGNTRYHNNNNNYRGRGSRYNNNNNNDAFNSNYNNYRGGRGRGRGNGRGNDRYNNNYYSRDRGRGRGREGDRARYDNDNDHYQHNDSFHEWRKK